MLAKWNLSDISEVLNTQDYPWYCPTVRDRRDGRGQTPVVAPSPLTTLERCCGTEATAFGIERRSSVHPIRPACKLVGAATGKARHIPLLGIGAASISRLMACPNRKRKRKRFLVGHGPSGGGSFIKTFTSPPSGASPRWRLVVVCARNESREGKPQLFITAQVANMAQDATGFLIAMQIEIGPMQFLEKLGSAAVKQITNKMPTGLEEAVGGAGGGGQENPTKCAMICPDAKQKYQPAGW
ncbi:GD12081 [Drosophila simulans]|uniref:GD12081 n=1 Tax=Drosophila simulans TaxID=7240 RepID=B4QKP2_DROSI|nr:GD12081 [Drosophila simulans]